jgi:hypothetical protein
VRSAALELRRCGQQSRNSKEEMVGNIEMESVVKTVDRKKIYLL